MAIVHMTVTGVSDEGDVVVVWGRSEGTPDEGEPVGFAFHLKGERADLELAEQASRLVRGNEVTIDYEPVAAGWNIGRGLAAPSV